jgi:hypothetical protein
MAIRILAQGWSRYASAVPPLRHYQATGTKAAKLAAPARVVALLTNGIVVVKPRSPASGVAMRAMPISTRPGIWPLEGT